MFNSARFALIKSRKSMFNQFTSNSLFAVYVKSLFDNHQLLTHSLLTSIRLTGITIDESDVQALIVLRNTFNVSYINTMHGVLVIWFCLKMISVCV